MNKQYLIYFRQKVKKKPNNQNLEICYKKDKLLKWDQKLNIQMYNKREIVFFSLSIRVYYIPA